MFKFSSKFVTPNCDVELGRERWEGTLTILIVFQAHYRILINSLLFSLLYLFLPFLIGEQRQQSAVVTNLSPVHLPKSPIQHILKKSWNPKALVPGTVQSAGQSQGHYSLHGNCFFPYCCLENPEKLQQKCFSIEKQNMYGYFNTLHANRLGYCVLWQLNRLIHWLLNLYSP